MKDLSYIDKKPSFKELYDLYSEINEIKKMVESLSDEDDTPQRASDLYLGIVDLCNHAKNLLTEK